MYNRYIPQPDGSYRRNRVYDPGARPMPPRQREHKQQEEPSCPPPQQDPPCPPPPPKQEPRQRQEKRHERDDSILGFLQNLIPKDLDTGDLIVILLLLLLAGDCEEDRSHALLTLALYLFM